MVVSKDSDQDLKQPPVKFPDKTYKATAHSELKSKKNFPGQLCDNICDYFLLEKYVSTN